MTQPTIITGNRTELFHLLQLKYALALEMKGMKYSRGSVCAYVKREFGFRGNAQKVYDQLCEHLKQREAALGVPPEGAQHGNDTSH